MTKRPLLWIVAPVYALALTAIVLIALAIILQSARNVLHARFDTELETRARLLALQVGNDLDLADTAALTEWCVSNSRESGDRITLYSPQRTLLADSANDDSARRQTPPEIDRAMRDGNALTTRHSEFSGLRTRYNARLIGTSGSPKAILRLGASLRPRDRAMAGLYLAAIPGALVAFVAAVALAWTTTQRVNRSAQRLQEGARRFATGDLGELDAEVGFSEHAALQSTMNQMARQLEMRFQNETAQRRERDAILESMDEGVVAVDNNQRIISANRAAASLLDLGVESMEGLPLIEVVRNAEFERFARTALNSDGPCQTELELHQAGTRNIEVRGAVLRNTSGESMGAVLVLDDVTQLRKLERVRKDFVSNVSHELRTPLTAIKGFVETLQTSAMNSPADAVRFLGLVAKHVNRLEAIIRDLTSLSRIEQDTRVEDLAFQSCSIRSIIENAAQTCEAARKKQNIDIHVQCEDDLAMRANSPLLEQCVVNLLDNAIKYSPVGSRVRVNVDSRGDNLVIEVTDEGIGIPLEHHERVFERFYRVDKGRSRDAGGTGLGLSIVRHIVQLHKGTITLDSRAGAGTTFRITLPATPAVPTAAPA